MKKKLNPRTNNLVSEVNKIILFALILPLTLGVFGVGRTNGYYNDTESSTGNTFISGNVDFTLTNSPFLPVTSALNLGVGDTATKDITINPGTSNPFKYLVEGKNFTGDTDFCGALNAKLNLGSTEMYNGSLSNLLTSPTETLGTWNLVLTLPTTLQNKICNFDTEYRGSQTRHDYPLMQGYNDTEIVSHTIASWGFRINKVYYDVNSAHGVEGDNEWVEIYNQTDTALDLSGWNICDNNSCDTIPASTPLIPAKGFGVITNDSSTWSFWDIPSDVVKIELGNNIGNGLANDEDMLILKRPDNVIIDQMNWGIPLSTWANFNSSVWDPGSIDVPAGHMLGRVPNGYDMNQASDFIDMAPPVVLLINPDQTGTGTWYWTYIYDILWTATNPNGSDSAIKINLSYIKDTDGTGTITPADETEVIATNLSNSGSYSWTLPGGFLGYIWVKIVAVGPENPMLNARMISGKVWDPFPTEMWIIDPEPVIESIIEAQDPEVLADAEEVIEEDVAEIPVVLEPETISALEPATEPEPIVIADIPPVTTTEIIETVPEVIPEVITEAVTEILETVETLIPTSSELVSESVTVIEPALVVEAEPVIVPELIIEPVSESAPIATSQE